MQKWCTEDWQFELTAIEGNAGHCRLELEKGDKFVFSYECPAGMCPKTMIKVYTWCEVIRCGGDFTYRGEKEKYEMNIPCADGLYSFILKQFPLIEMKMKNLCQTVPDQKTSNLYVVI